MAISKEIRNSKKKHSSSGGGGSNDKKNRNHILTSAVFKAVESLGLTKDQTLAILKLRPATYARRRNLSHLIDEKSLEGNLAILFLRLYRSLFSYWGGNLESCKDWLRADHQYFGNAPIETIKTLEGLVDVTNYLDSLRGL